MPYHVVGWAGVEGRVVKEFFVLFMRLASQRKRVFLHSLSLGATKGNFLTFLLVCGV